MQTLSIKSGSLNGTVRLPGDKSITHRALIIGSLQNKGKHIILQNWLQSLDCFATLHILQKLGVKFIQDGSNLSIQAVGLHGLHAANMPLDVGNSGTTMRLLTGLLAAQKFDSQLCGDLSICKRPMQRVITPLELMGANIVSNNGYAPLQIYGGQKLRAINYALPVASAQVKSAIMLASLYADGASQITSPKSCRDHTELMLDFFNSNLSPEIIYDIPVDISSAAFLLVAAMITPNSAITLHNVGINPTRSAILELLLQMGANLSIQNPRCVNNEIRADLSMRYTPNLIAITVPTALIANAIDDLPILCLAATCATGTTYIRDAKELRYKESDRIAMLAAGFSTLGVKVVVYEDGLAITGSKLGGGVISSGSDHRIAMTFILAGLIAKEPVIVQDVENIATSFPGFVEVLQTLGVQINIGEKQVA